MIDCTVRIIKLWLKQILTLYQCHVFDNFITKLIILFRSFCPYVPICQSVVLSYLSACLSILLSLYESVCQFVWQFVSCMFIICLYMYTSLNPSTCFVCLSAYFLSVTSFCICTLVCLYVTKYVCKSATPLSVCWFACLSVCHYLYVSFCPSVCLSICKLVYAFGDSTLGKSVFGESTFG